MIIFKYKKTIAASLVFLLVMTLAGLPLPAAKARRGSTVEVIMADGSVVKGELLAVKSDVLLIYDKDAGQGNSLDLQHVAQIKALKKSKLGKGLLIGLGVGFGLCVYNNWIMGRHNGLNEYSYAFIFPVTIPLGGIIGTLASIPKKFSLAGAASEIRLEKLKKLTRYARERD